MEPSENLDHLFRELEPPCFSLRWNKLGVKFVKIIGLTNLVENLVKKCGKIWLEKLGGIIGLKSGVGKAYSVQCTVK